MAPDPTVILLPQVIVSAIRRKMSHEHLHPPTSYSQFTAIRSVSPKRISQHKINHPFRPTGMLSSVDHMFHSLRRGGDGSGQSATPKMNQNNSFQLPLRTCPDRSMFISFIQIPGLRCMLSVSAHSPAHALAATNRCAAVFGWRSFLCCTHSNGSAQLLVTSPRLCSFLPVRRCISVVRSLAQHAQHDPLVLLFSSR